MSNGSGFFMFISFIIIIINSSSSSSSSRSNSRRLVWAIPGWFCRFVRIFLGPPTFLQQVTKDRTLKMRTSLSLETSGSDCPSMQGHIPEERNPQLNRCENLTTRIHFVKMENCLTSIVWSSKRRYCTGKFVTLSLCFIRVFEVSPPPTHTHTHTHTVEECERQVKSIVYAIK